MGPGGKLRGGGGETEFRKEVCSRSAQKEALKKNPDLRRDACWVGTVSYGSPSPEATGQTAVISDGCAG